jgi:1-pyrroline-4-hydroxy-2-carboxylate deaminase
MAMDVQWTGIYPAVTTKFTAADQLDLPLFSKNIEAQLAAGVEGLILGGTLGESSVLTEGEKERLVKHAVELARDRVPVVLNIAEGATAEAIRQAGLAKQWGAKGLMLLPPMRYKTDHRETVAFFKAVANSTDLPIMIYNNPVDYKTEVTLDMFAELVDCTNIQAIKESTCDVSNVTRLRNRFGNRLKILCGVDTIGMEELLMGADGGLVCAFPQETVALYRYVKAGNIEAALAIHRWFLPLLELDIHPKLVQYIKLAEAMVELGSEHVRAPRLPLDGEERERITAIIARGIAARPLLNNH